MFVVAPQLGPLSPGMRDGLSPATSPTTGAGLFQYFLGLELLNPETSAAKEKNPILENGLENLSPKKKDQNLDPMMALLSQNPQLVDLKDTKEIIKPNEKGAFFDRNSQLINSLEFAKDDQETKSLMGLDIASVDSNENPINLDEADKASGKENFEIKATNDVNQKALKDFDVQPVENGEAKIQRDGKEEVSLAGLKVENEASGAREAMDPGEAKGKKGNSNEKNEIKLDQLINFANLPLFEDTKINEVSSNSVSASTQDRLPISDVFSKVEGMIQQGGGKMRISLDPPHLGEVQVEVTTRGNKVEVKLSSLTEASRSLLESGIGELRQSIQSQNLVLAKVEVHLESSMNHFSNAFNQQQNFQQGNESFSGQTTRQINAYNDKVVSVGEELESLPRIASWNQRNGVGGGRVDIRI